MEYKVLTLWQPWASLLVHGIKKIETRPKPTRWTAEKGTYLINAASKWSKEQAKLCLMEPFFANLYDLTNEIGMSYHSKTGKTDFICNLPLGQIIGSIEVTECHKIHNNNSLLRPLYFTSWNKKESMYNAEYIQSLEESFGDYSDGRYAWLTQNPRVLKTPISYKGGQGYYQNFKGDINQLIFL